MVSSREARLKDSVLVTGFHGIGGTGYLAVSYLVNALRAKRIGFIHWKRIPPFTFTDGKHLVAPVEIYRHERLVLVKTEFSPQGGDEATFGEFLAEWVIGQRFREAILVGGLDSSLRGSNPGDSVRIISTKPYLRKVKRLGIPILEPGLVVYGPVATMMVTFEMNRFPAVTILPYADARKPDFGAASEAIRRVSSILGLSINVSDLELGAWYVEAEIEARRVELEKLSSGMFV